MDLGEWHSGQSYFRGFVLAPSAAAAALQTSHSVLPGPGDGWQSLFRNRLLSLFRRLQLWRLGRCDPGLATALDVAAWAGRTRWGFVLCVHARGRRGAKTIP